MTHCTVCGAAAREGAKFCTSCGARLVDTVSAPAAEPVDAAATTATEPSAIDAPAATDAEQPAAESTWGPVENSDADIKAGDAPSEAAVPDAPETEAAASPEYTTSWPTGESETVAAADPGVAEPAGADPASDTPNSAGAPWSSWSSESDNTVTGVAPESFATDADQDARSDVQREAETGVADAEVDEPVAAEPEASDPMDDSHHGASEWESWAPEASGGATVAAASGDVGSSVRRMLDDLANRIDRLIDPAPVGGRGVDADDLADQLTRWSKASTDADGLLEVVRAVRTSPRDVDALTRLADRAPDLELLVRHYQAITGSAGDWASKLRDQKAPDPDDA